MAIKIEDLKNISDLVKFTNYELYFKLCKYINMIEYGFSKYIFYYVEELNAHMKDFNNKELIELIEKLKARIGEE